jgi:predicted lipoprotein with Yx(FWY)xxD motif
VKRTLMPLAAIAALALAASAPASTTHRSTVKLAKSSLGKVLVNGSGFTVYEFTKDRRNTDMCVKISGCAATWPPLMAHGRPIAGTGVKASLLGTISLPHGRRQVTYGGHPLYLYSGDTSRAETDYVGTPQFGGTWYAANAAGHMVK